MNEPAITIDFRPTLTVEQLVAKMGPIRRNFLAEARQRWRLSDPVFAILAHSSAGASAASSEALATALKECTIPLKGPRPIEEAISSAGGVRWGELNSSLMLHRLPGIFLAGEMIDWEAPTGGYLMQGCFATGTRAGHAVRKWLGLSCSE
jgi:predicted flavoprotein YhiN